MRIKGSDVQKLFTLMPEALDNIVTTEQYISDDETFVTLTPLAMFSNSANNRPDELLDIKLIASTVFAALKDCSKDTTNPERAIKITNELNAEFDNGISCFSLLLESLHDNDNDSLSNESDNSTLNKIVNELLASMHSLAFKEIPNFNKLLDTINAHKLFLTLQEWETEAYEIFDYVEAETDEKNRSKKEIFAAKREALFKNCDELLATAPQEFKRMLMRSSFPALFLLSYLKNNYKRELSLMELDREVLINKLVAAAAELVGTFYSREAEAVLNKICMEFENTYDINKTKETKEILAPLIIRLIRVLSDGCVSRDEAHIYNTIINLIDLIDDVNITDNNGDTPLHAAMPQEEYSECYYVMKLDLINYLLHNGANIDAVNNQQQTPFELAAKYMKDSDAATVVAVMLQDQSVDIDILELALFDTIIRKNPKEVFSGLKTFTILETELQKFTQWSPQEFFEKFAWFSNDNAETLDVYEAQQNIFDATILIQAMSHFNVPLNTFFEANIKNVDTATPAIVGALLASSKVCSIAANDNSANVLEYLKQYPELCSYMNNNFEKIITMLKNINAEKLSEDHESFATSYDILKICRFDNNDSPEYILFTLRILVEHVFSTQFIPVSVVARLPSDYTKAIEEQVKQQLKSAVFALIDAGVNIEPIKAYLTQRNSGLNKIYFMSFVKNFLNDIHEREVTHRELNSSTAIELLPTYEGLNSGFHNDGIIGIDLEEGQSKNVSKFSSRVAILKQ